jgi:hypothetical protein
LSLSGPAGWNGRPGSDRGYPGHGLRFSGGLGGRLGPGLGLAWQGGFVRRTPVAGRLGPAVSGRPTEGPKKRPSTEHSSRTFPWTSPTAPGAGPSSSVPVRSPAPTTTRNRRRNRARGRTEIRATLEAGSADQPAPPPNPSSLLRVPTQPTTRAPFPAQRDRERPASSTKARTKPRATPRSLTAYGVLPYEVAAPRTLAVFGGRSRFVESPSVAERPMQNLRRTKIDSGGGAGRIMIDCVAPGVSRLFEVNRDA